jgi:hypothetical protein
VATAPAEIWIRCVNAARRPTTDLSFDYRIAAAALRGAALFFAFTRIPDEISGLKR